MKPGMKRIDIRITGDAGAGKTRLVRDHLLNALHDMYVGQHEGRGSKPAYTYVDEGVTMEQHTPQGACVHIHIDVRNRADAVFPCDDPARQPCARCGDPRSGHTASSAGHDFVPIP